ncbi:MAG: MBL fold metallo-hydrolase [Terriglobales bacterium]
MLEQITFPVGPLACNCTLLGDPEAATAIVIDPGADVVGILRRLTQRHWRLTAILITHGHLDHVGGAAELQRATGAPVWLHPRDRGQLELLDWQANFLGMAPPAAMTVDGDLTVAAQFVLGPERIEVLETPGHTEGSVSLWLPIEKKLFAGDTLFAGSIGRTDLPGGDSRAILESIRGTLLQLPDATIVIPGHGPETTIGRERHGNPFLI